MNSEDKEMLKGSLAVLGICGLIGGLFGFGIFETFPAMSLGAGVGMSIPIVGVIIAVLLGKGK